MSEKDELGTSGDELPEETEADGGAGGTEDGTDWWFVATMLVVLIAMSLVLFNWDSVSGFLASFR